MLCTPSSFARGRVFFFLNRRFLPFWCVERTVPMPGMHISYHRSSTSAQNYRPDFGNLSSSQTCEVSFSFLCFLKVWAFLKFSLSEDAQLEGGAVGTHGVPVRWLTLGVHTHTRVKIFTQSLPSKFWCLSALDLLGGWLGPT